MSELDTSGGLVTEINGMDTNNVINWTGRSVRVRKQTRTYWEEYVTTDEWYASALVEDVPTEEMHAACFDEDVVDDDGSGE